jgi:hypothetical protein
MSIIDFPDRKKLGTIDLNSYEGNDYETGSNHRMVSEPAITLIAGKCPHCGSHRVVYQGDRKIETK